MQGRINADPMLNPDELSRPSPVLLRFYELVEREAFEAADFVSLDKDDKTTLGADLVARKDLIIQPGEERDLRKTLSPKTKFIAVMAAYREIDKATWRAVLEVKRPTVNKGAFNQVAIKLDSLAVQLSLLNK